MIRTGARLGVALAVLLLAQPARADDVGTQTVDAVNALFGPQNGFRALHAKGLVTQGTFRASPGASALSRAVLFDGSTIPVTVRFSDGSGAPMIPDGSEDANPHGMAIKFRLPDGSETDMVTNALKFFPFSTAEQLRDLFRAIKASPPDAPKPTALDTFLAAHPNVKAANATVATPASYAEENYFGQNAFVLVNKAGARQAVRYVLEPERLVHLDPAEAARRPPNFLADEMRGRLARGPVTFRLLAQIAAPDDQTVDPSRPWPADRRRVELGRITIDTVVPNSDEAQKALLFLPGQITDGIELSDDPMVTIRDEAYAVSFSRRNP
ncbi:catalase family peroxidase [Salinarimonas soli]|uniref:Catalase-related peroxidase n=1 Tax=Salinarimonas soli TaxID=1638099 RepID=A0A5B2VE27_9HYPH|nr:catalase family peroxidase [Salinarimonas soli]KAA2236619.1 catalase family peroxidase [Salinarimonas soli]